MKLPIFLLATLLCQPAMAAGKKTPTPPPRPNLTSSSSWSTTSVGAMSDSPVANITTLYDLKTDPFEEKDVARDNPQQTQRLRARLETWLKDTGAQPPQARN